MLTQDFKQQIGEIFLLALQANQSKEFNVWIQYMGHVDYYVLRISTDNREEILFDDDFYGDDENRKLIQYKLKEWKKHLMQIIAPPIIINPKSLQDASH